LADSTLARQLFGRDVGRDVGRDIGSSWVGCWVEEVKLNVGEARRLAERMVGRIMDDRT
jgi:hypothetical protein